MLKITREGADLIDSGLIDKKAIKLKVTSWNKQYRIIKRHFRYSLLDDSAKIETMILFILFSMGFVVILCMVISVTEFQHLPSWFGIPMLILFAVLLCWYFTINVIMFDEGITVNKKVFLPKVKLQIEEDIIDLTLHEKEELLTKFAQGIFGIKKNKDNTFTVLKYNKGEVSEDDRGRYYCPQPVCDQMIIDHWYSITDLVYDKAKIND